MAAVPYAFSLFLLSMSWLRVTVFLLRLWSIHITVEALGIRDTAVASFPLRKASARRTSLDAPVPLIRGTIRCLADSVDESQTSNISRSYLATCLPGLSNVLCEELNAIEGLYRIKPSGPAAVTFESDQIDGPLNALVWVRTAHKLMEWIGEAHNLRTREDLYDATLDLVDVKQLLGDGKGGLLTLSVQVMLQGQNLPKDLRHTHYSALTIKNALVDSVRNKRGDRPIVDIDNASVPLVGTLRADRESDGTGASASLSLYRSLHPPGSLHRRGYRRGMAIHKASMKESMAAGLLLAAKYHPENVVLVDPMAGSGSLVIEAAMMAADLSPGLMRIKCGVPGHQLPPVLKWKSSQREGAMDRWKNILVTATQRAKRGLQAMQTSERPGILANDVHGGALDILEASLEQAGLQHVVEVHQKDCREWLLPNNDNYMVVTNPPWGVRLTEEMHESWESLRQFLRSCPPNTEAWVLSGNKEATKHLGLKRSQSIVLQTGQQNLRWIQYLILDKPPEGNRSERNIKSRPKHERRSQQAPARSDDKGPLSDAERQERMRSWLI